MLTRTQRSLILLITYLPVLIMLIISSIHVARQVELVLSNAQELLSDQLTAQFGKQVVVREATLLPFGTAIVKGLQIAEAGDLSQGTLLTADTVIVRYDFRAVVFGGAGASGIRTVDLRDPVVHLVRRSDGSLNILDLLRPKPGPPRPPFRGIVRLYNARATFADLRKSALSPTSMGRIKPFRLHDLDLTYNAQRYPLLTFAGTALGDVSTLKSTSFTGTYNPRLRSLKLDLSAVEASAPFVAQLTGISRHVDVRKGRVTGTLGLSTKFPLRGLPYMTGFATVSGAEVLAPGLQSPVKDLSGRILLAGRSAALDLTGVLGGTRARATGMVANFQAPKLNLSVSAPRVNIAGLLSSFGISGVPPHLRIQGIGSVAATITGTRAAPSARTAATIGSLSAFGYTAADITLEAQYQQGTIFLDSVNFRIDGARVRASGSLGTTGSRTVSLEGTVRAFPLRILNVPAGTRLTGTADADFAVSGTLSAPTVRADARISRGSVGGMPFTGASVEVSYDSGRRTGLGTLVANAAGGLIAAQGSGGPRSVNVRYTIEAVDMATVASLLKQPDLSGILYSSGTVSGDSRDPVVAGVLEVFRGRYQDYELDYARVAYSGDRQGITVRSGVARAFPAEVRFSGRASGLDTARVDFAGDAEVRRLQIQKLMELTGKKADIKGTVEGDFAFTSAFLRGLRTRDGRPQFVDTTASGTLRLTDATAFGFLISSAGAKIDFSNDIIRLSETSIASQDARVDLNGTVNVETRQLDLSFDARDFDLVRIRDRVEKYFTIGGIASASGAITGPWDDPDYTMQASITGLTLNEATFDQATIEAAYSDQTFSSWRALLTRGQQVFDLQGTDLDLKTACVDSATAQIQNVRVPDLWAIIAASPYLLTEQAEPIREAFTRVPRLTSGTMNGGFSFQGCFRDEEGRFTLPDGSVKLTAKDVGVDIRQIDSLDIDVASANGAVTINRFQAVSDDTTVQVGPTTPGAPVYVNETLDLMLAANNVDLSRLRPWLGENTPSGIATVDFIFTGPVRRPDIRGSIEVVRPGIRGIEFDNLRVSQIRFRADRIDVTDIFLAFNGHQVIGSGYIPWSWEELTIPKDRPVQFSASLANEDLDILNAFASTIDTSRTTGALEAQINVGGTIDAINLTGAIRTTNGTIGVRGVGSSLTNVTVDIGFEGRTITFKTFAMQSSTGGTIGLQPGGTIVVTEPAQGFGNVNLQLMARGLTVEERGLMGYQESARVQLDVGLDISGTIAEPVISVPATGFGGIKVSNSELAFSLPEGGRKAIERTLPIRPLFRDIPIVIGDGVRVRPPQMSILVGGSGKISGQLGNPSAAVPFNVTLELEAREGDITLRGTGIRFAVVPGGKMILRLNEPPVASEVVLSNFQATTSLTATGPMRTRERYRITMTVNGPVSNMNITLTSDPPGLTKEQILAALGHVEGLFGGREADLQAQLATALTAVGTSALFMPIQRIFVERLGFEEFSLEYSPISPLALYVSRRLFGDFYVSLYQRLGAALANVQNVEWQFRISYRFKTFYSVGIGIDDQQTVTGNVTFVKAFW